MPLIDLPLTELRTFTGDLVEPDDLDAFWAGTIAEAREHDLEVTCEPYATPWTGFDTYDVTFPGFGGHPVKAWLTVPTGATGPLPTVVQYHGYSVGRSFPHTSFTWAGAGYAHIAMDNRGQGYHAGGPAEATVDASADAGLPHAPGLFTAGILDPHTYYYRRLYTDAVRLLEAVSRLSHVDPLRIAVTGASQGGTLSLAAAGLARLVDVPLVGAAPDVPALCAIARSLELTDAGPWGEIHQYLAGWRDRVDTVYRTLSYFDVALIGQRATAPVLFSLGLMDPVCLPSTVFAAFNRYGTPSGAEVQKSISVYRFNGHEGGGPHHVMEQADFFAEVLGGSNG